MPVSEIKAARRKALAMLVEATKLHEKDKGVSEVQCCIAQYGAVYCTVVKCSVV